MNEGIVNQSPIDASRDEESDNFFNMDVSSSGQATLREKPDLKPQSLISCKMTDSVLESLKLSHYAEVF